MYPQLYKKFGLSLETQKVSLEKKTSILRFTDKIMVTDVLNLKKNDS